MSQVDSQASMDGGIIIQVLGQMSNKSLPTRKFCQTFFLAEQTSGYYVLNDIFRYLKDDVIMDAPMQPYYHHQPQAPAPAPLQQQQQPDISGMVNGAPENGTTVVDKATMDLFSHPYSNAAPVAPAAQPTATKPAPPPPQQQQQQQDPQPPKTQPQRREKSRSKSPEKETTAAAAAASSPSTPLAPAGKPARREWGDSPLPAAKPEKPATVAAAAAAPPPVAAAAAPAKPASNAKTWANLAALPGPATPPPAAPPQQAAAPPPPQPAAAKHKQPSEGKHDKESYRAASTHSPLTHTQTRKETKTPST